MIYLTSPLHDIGKVGIPDTVLLKPGRLSDSEFTIMKTHACIGAETLDAALREFLASREYTTAPVTFDSDEYVFDLVYTRAKRAGYSKSMERIASSYLNYMEQIFGHYEKRSRAVLGREPAQILLLHANEINSRGDHSHADQNFIQQ